jgi:iron complex outermembrane recepter protein
MNQLRLRPYCSLAIAVCGDSMNPKQQLPILLIGIVSVLAIQPALAEVESRLISTSGKSKTATTLSVPRIHDLKRPSTTVTEWMAQSNAQQEGASEEDEVDEEVVVTGESRGSTYFTPKAATGTRTDTPLRDVPQSVQVVPQQVLKDQQITRPEEAFRNVSGVSASGSGEGSGLSVNARGFSGTPVLLDGFRQFGALGLQDTQETVNLEQIEVLKGPSSILYGEVQPGGVINQVSKQPLLNPFYSAELQIGSRGLIRPQIDFSGPLTADKSFLYRLNGVYERSDSFRDFDTTQQRFFIAPVLAWKIGQQTDLTLKFDYLDSKQPFDTGRIAVGNRVLKTPRDRIFGEPGDSVESKIFNVGYNFEHRFNDNWKLRNSLRYSSKEILQEFAFPAEFDETTGTLTRNFGGFDINIESFSLQTNMVGKFTTGPVKHTLLFGVDSNRTVDDTFAGVDFVNPLVLDVNNPIYKTAPRPDFRATDPFVNRQVRENRLGIYLQDQVELLDNLKLLAGLRYDTVDIDIRGGATSVSPDGINVNQNDTAFTPRVGFVYQPIKPLSLYASYSKSFAPNTDSSLSGSVLKAERGEGWEVGGKAELAKGKLFTTLAYFDITKQNVATTDPNNSLFSIAAGEQRSRGVELDVTGQILPGWDLIAFYAYTDAKVTKDNTIPVGNRLSGIPKHSASFWTTYAIQNGPMRGLGVGVGLNFVGERTGDALNSFDLENYLLTNAAIFYKRDRYRAAINFKNIFDVDYTSGTPFSRTRIEVGEPFTVVGSLSMEF